MQLRKRKARSSEILAGRIGLKKRGGFKSKFNTAQAGSSNSESAALKVPSCPGVLQRPWQMETGKLSSQTRAESKSDPGGSGLASAMTGAQWHPGV